MEITLNERASEKINKACRLLEGVPERDQYLNEIVSHVLFKIADDDFLREIEKSIPMETLISILIKDEKYSKKLREAVSLTSRKRKYRITSEKIKPVSDASETP